MTLILSNDGHPELCRVWGSYQQPLDIWRQRFGKLLAAHIGHHREGQALGGLISTNEVVAHRIDDQAEDLVGLIEQTRGNHVANLPEGRCGVEADEERLEGDNDFSPQVFKSPQVTSPCTCQ